MAATLRDLAAACGADRRAAVARELTKLHEQIVRGTLDELIAAVADGTIPARGEVAIVIGMRGQVGRGQASGAANAGGASADHPATDDPTAAARADVERLVADGVARGDAARRVAAATGIPRRQLYGGGPEAPTTD